MKSSLKIVSIIVLLVGIGTFLMIFMISSFFQDSSAEIEKESLNIEFSGVVESIRYSEKGYPTALINKQYIYIPAANNDKLKLGDSVVKNQGENIVYQFRKQELIDSLKGSVIIDSISSCNSLIGESPKINFERITVDAAPPVQYEITTHLYIISCDTNYQINHSNQKVYINKEHVAFITDSSIIRNLYNESDCKYKKQWKVWFFPKSSEKIETKEEYKKLLIKMAEEDIVLKINESLTLKGKLLEKEFESTFGKKAW